MVAIEHISKRHHRFSCKRVKVIQRCLKMIFLSSGIEISNRNGPLLLYFKRKLPQLFSRKKKMLKASIIVSLNWKLRFPSNSISRSGSGLGTDSSTNPNKRQYWRHYLELNEKF